MNRKALIALGLVILVSPFFRSAPVRADADDDGGREVTINVGTVADDEEPGRVLVEVEYQGADGTIASHNARYFWIEGEFGANLTAHGADALSELEVNVVPVTIDQLPKNGEDLDDHTSFRVLPMGIRRYLDLGIQGSATIHVLGFALEKEADLSEAAHLEAFASLGVDLLGVQYMNLGSSGTLAGLELGDVSVAGGVAWNMTDRLALKLSVGAETGAAVSTSGQLDMTPSAFSKLEMAYKTLHADYAVFLEGEYERLDLFSQADAIHRGEFELKLGFSVSF